MASLTWICALTLALFCCLNGQPIKPTIKPTSKPSVKADPELILETLALLKGSEERCTVNLNLYFPQRTDKMECMNSTLLCIQKELENLYNNCSSSEDHRSLIDDISTNLNPEDWGFKTGQSKTLCPVCQSGMKVNYLQFLDKIENLVQELNSSQ